MEVRNYHIYLLLKTIILTIISRKMTVKLGYISKSGYIVTNRNYYIMLTINLYRERKTVSWYI